MVVARLDQYEARLRGEITIRARVAKLVEKLTARESTPLVLAARRNTSDQGEKPPADVYVAGPG